MRQRFLTGDVAVIILSFSFSPVSFTSTDIFDPCSIFLFYCVDSAMVISVDWPFGPFDLNLYGKKKEKKMKEENISSMFHRADSLDISLPFFNLKFSDQ